jgi:hypothetical protein
MMRANRLRICGFESDTRQLYRAYLISRHLREVYRGSYEEAILLLDVWLAWARRCRLAPFVKLAKTITEQRPGIEAATRSPTTSRWRHEPSMRQRTT